jgi:hypothetical protein
MSNMTLLFFGIVVFGLMLVGMALTVTEFRRLTDEEASGPDKNAGKTTSARNAKDHD